jgi:hypothetical protein
MIVINARFLTQPITGVQRYAVELSLRLKQIDPLIHFVCPKDVIQHELFRQLDAEIVGCKTRQWWEQIELPRYLKAHNNPLLVELGGLAAAYYGNKITAIHDITSRRYPQSFSLRHHILSQLLTSPALRNSLSVITVSEFSKKEISGYFRKLPPPIYTCNI